MVTLDELDEAFLLKANRNGGIAFLALHESGSIDFCRPTSFETGFRGNTREAYMRLRAHANGEIVLSRIPWNNKEKRFAHVESILPVEDPKGLGQWLNFFAANIWQASRNIYGKPLPKPRAPYLG